MTIANKTQKNWRESHNNNNIYIYILAYIAQISTLLFSAAYNLVENESKITILILKNNYLDGRHGKHT